MLELEQRYHFPFSNEAVTAVHEAVDWSHNSKIGTEHLLLGLCEVGVPILEHLGVDIEKLKMIKIVLPSSYRAPQSYLYTLRFTHRANRVIRSSVSEARRLEDSTLMPDHILLGLLRIGQGIAAGYLGSLGVTLDNARQVIENRDRQLKMVL